MGLGTYPEVGIADARHKGLIARQSIAAGQDPIEKRRADTANRKAIAKAMTFEQAALKVHEGAETRLEEHQACRTSGSIPFENTHFLKIGKRKVADLVVADFAEVLRPIWLSSQKQHQESDSVAIRS